jgi:hypothetical protein
MSIQSVQSTIERIQRDLSSLHQKMTTESRNEASKTERISQIRRGITSSASPATVQSKLREIEYIDRDLISIQKKKSDLTKQISDKTSELYKYQQQLFREQELERKKMLDSFKRKEEESRHRQDGLLRQISFIPSVSLGGIARTVDTNNAKYDAFISHANEDKEDLVRTLAEKLKESGFNVWYDDFQLKVGDSLRRSIDRGLANSTFGIVVLSRAFFEKDWPQYELDGLVAKEMEGSKVILPLWHKISKDEVMKYSPTLADKLALNTTTKTIDELVKDLGDVLRGS